MNSIPLLLSPEACQRYQIIAPLFGTVLKTLYKELQTVTQEVSYKYLDMRFRDLVHKTICAQGYMVDLTLFSQKKNHLEESFGNTLCVSVNDCVAHGKNTILLKLGDLATIDVGIGVAYKDTDKLNVSRTRQLVFDSAFTVVIGSSDLPEVAKAPLRALKEIENLTGKIGIRDIAEIIQDHGWKKNLSVVTGLAGHGIGYSMHEYPGIPNAVFKNTTIKLPPHIMINPEPMYVKANGEKVSPIRLDNDGWSVMTNGPSAHWETTYYYDGKKLRDIVGITQIVLEKGEKQCK